MQRPILLVIIPTLMTVCATARSQQENAAPAMQEQQHPEPPAPIVVVVHGKKKSPGWTQTRTFTTTRFWRLDPGEQSLQLWYTGRFKHDGVSGQNTHLWQVEYMMSVLKGLQMDVYFNYAHDPQQGFHIEGAQVEARIAPWDYGKVWANPTLYLEWHPQTRGPNRGEARLLLGGELGTERLRGAINPFYEQNLDSATGARADFEPQIEMGVSGAAQYAIVPEFSAGLEARYSAEQQGADPKDPHKFQNVFKLGPALWVSSKDGRWFAVASALGGLTKYSDAFATTVVLGVR